MGWLCVNGRFGNCFCWPGRSRPAKEVVNFRFGFRFKGKQLLSVAIRYLYTQSVMLTFTVRPEWKSADSFVLCCWHWNWKRKHRHLIAFRFCGERKDMNKLCTARKSCVCVFVLYSKLAQTSNLVC